ncbi:DUF1015 family protein [Robiginitalea sp.]|nr:DUF1015 family protein [Robiginitalea sp.]
MAKFVPFKAIRPRFELSEQVVTRSYESYSFKDRLNIQSQNPHSFLHVLNPEFESRVRLRGMKRYRKVREKLDEFLSSGILTREDKPGFYLYRNTEEGQSAMGLLGGIAISDYVNDSLKRHEDTLSIREKRFADFLQGAQFNAEPVLVTYPNHPEIDRLMAEINQTKPEISFTDDQFVTHELWSITEQHRIAQIEASFSEVAKTYLMDGHHRSASSVLYANRNFSTYTNKELPHQYFMGCLMPETEIRIASFSRVLTNLGGLSYSEIFSQLRNNFLIEDMGEASWEPTASHEFSMFLGNRFYKLQWQNNHGAHYSPFSTLDAQILNAFILNPIFGITDPRNDERLNYLWGMHPGIEIQKAVISGAFSIGFGMVPTALSEIKQIADAGKTLPPKSTFIKPKLPSGLTIYEL